jgi:hypothetical protein
MPEAKRTRALRPWTAPTNSRSPTAQDPPHVEVAELRKLCNVIVTDPFESLCEILILRD